MLKERGLYRKLPELIQSENVPEIRYSAVATVSAASRGLWRRGPKVTDDLSLGIAVVRRRNFDITPKRRRQYDPQDWFTIHQKPIRKYERLMPTKDLLIRQTKLAFSEDPEMSLMVSIQGLTADNAARRLNDRIWTIEEIVFHVAFWKIEYCRQGFGRWNHPIRSLLTDFQQTIKFLEAAQAHLMECLQACSEESLSRPIPTQNHGKSAAHFFSVMAIHDVSHAAQIRTIQRVLGLRTDFYPIEETFS
jgi:DinB superfamily